MKSLLAVFAVLGALTTAALADETQNESVSDDATEAEAEQDCSTLEGDAKTECEAKKAESEKSESSEEKTQKGGKGMTESNDGNMESYDSDE